jgi:hypothetical protein
LVESQRQRREQDKQGDVDRKVGLPPELQREVERRDGQPKPYDAGFLSEIASHPVAEAYIDTMAQDAATAPWSVQQRDEQTEIADDQLSEAERTLEGLHPEKSFRDLREMAARNTLQLGDGAWVLHFYADGSGLAEAIPVNTRRLYKVVDEHGITTGYMEVSHRNRSVSHEYELEEVAWFEWSSRPSGVYGRGPVEKGVEVLEVLEELSDKEIKDLEEGMPPGIVSVKEDEDTPMAVDAYENVKDNWKLKEGERHRAIVSMGDWQFTPLSPGYQELQFLERNKFWIQALGAVFKVNAPYAGFDFQEGNKAQNQAQAAAYAQRGFRVLLRQMQEAINRQVVWPHISEEVQFEFETEQTSEERQAHARFLQELGDAAEQWDSLGRDVTYRDGQIEVADGEVETPEDAGGDGGGGIFGSVNAGTAKGAVDLAAPAGREAISEASLDEWHSFRRDVELLDGQIVEPESGRTYPEDDLAPSRTLTVHGLDMGVVEALLSKYESLQWRARARDEQHAHGKTEVGQGLSMKEIETVDDVLLEAYKSQIWPAGLDGIEKRVWSGDESVPEYVIKQIQEAIRAGGAVFSDIDSVPDDAVADLEGILEDSLTQPQGWSLESVVGDMTDQWPGVGEGELEVVARTETASVLNEARERGYEDMPDSATAKFYWQGPDDSRTTEACEELKERTNPQYGGTPVSMNELVRMEQEVQAKYFENLSFRKHTPHINCRHTFVKQVDALVDEEGF